MHLLSVLTNCVFFNAHVYKYFVHVLVILRRQIVLCSNCDYLVYVFKR